MDKVPADKVVGLFEARRARLLRQIAGFGGQPRRWKGLELQEPPAAVLGLAARLVSSLPDHLPLPGAELASDGDVVLTWAWAGRGPRIEAVVRADQTLVWSCCREGGLASGEMGCCEGGRLPTELLDLIGKQRR